MKGRMKTTIERDGHRWCYTAQTVDGKLAVHEGGFCEREAAAEQAAAAIRDLKRFEKPDLIRCPKCGRSYETDFPTPGCVRCADCDYLLRTSD